MRLCLIAFIVGFASACSGAGENLERSSAEAAAMVGSPARGEQLMLNYGCSACHTIPGIVGANTFIGPTLTNMAECRYIAGALLNTPENLAHWIQNPKAVEPNTAMPNVGVTAQDALDVVSYLYAVE